MTADDFLTSQGKGLLMTDHGERGSPPSPIWAREGVRTHTTPRARLEPSLVDLRHAPAPSPLQRESQPTDRIVQVCLHAE